MIHVNWQNVLDGHGFAITIIGMAIVFSGLVLISLFIAQLPRLLALFDRLTTSAPRLAAPKERPFPEGKKSWRSSVWWCIWSWNGSPGKARKSPS